MLSQIEILECYARAATAEGVNITETYEEWLNVAFCCSSVASATPSARLAVFLSLSKQSAKYNEQENIKKFNEIERTEKRINNIAYIIKQFNIRGYRIKEIIKRYATNNTPPPTPPPPQSNVNITAIPLDWKAKAAKRQPPPSLLSEIKQIRPLQPLFHLAEKNEDQARAALWGLIAGTAAACPRVNIIYDGKKQNIHIYYMLIAPAASGKGILSDIRTVFEPLQDEARSRATADYVRYKQELQATKKEDRELIERPKSPTFWLPADTSTSALINAVRDNDGGGCIWESELDTINRAIKSDYGNYTDTLRNNYHGETITYLRKTGREFISLKQTHFGAVIAGTMGQCLNFFKSTENGLFSRFAFGTIESGSEWADKFNRRGVDREIEELRAHVLPKIATAQHCYAFTRQQQQEHMKYYSARQSEIIDPFGSAGVSLLRRAALTQLRAAATLSLILAPSIAEINATAWHLSKMLIDNAINTGLDFIEQLPNEESRSSKKEEKQEKTYNTLPRQFTKQHQPQNISRATWYRWVSEWERGGKIEKTQQGIYKKRE